MVIFRENSEDIYAGIEWEAESRRREEAHRLPDQGDGRQEDPLSGDVRHRHQAGVARRHRAAVRKAIQYAIDNDRQSVTIVHKGNIMKFTEGALPRLGLRARAEGVRRAADRRRSVVQVQEPEDRPRHRRQGRDRRRVPAADPAAARRVRRHRDAQPQRRLHLGRARRAGRRHRHRAGREHVRHGRDVRGDARHGAEVRRQGLRESRLAKSSPPR